MKVKIIVLMLLTGLYSFNTNAQNIVQAEYYFDTNPGYGNATQITIPTPSTDVSGLLVNANVSALSSGFHTMYMRTKDALGRWSMTNNLVFAKHVLPLAASAVLNIDKAEYFFNTDLGFGNGVNIPLTASANIGNLLFNADVTALPQGFHTLYVRVRDAQGKWSVLNNYPFAKQITIPGAGTVFNINKAEYFFDTDPGFENGVNIPLTTSANISNLLINADVTALPQGFHTMYIRVRDAQGKWSILNNYPFAKHRAVPPAAAILNITKAEYFFDADPGYGSGTNIAITPSTDINNLAIGVDITSLASGFHTLYIRTADANNKWGQTNAYPFAKHLSIAPPNALSNITRIEYFLDTDPGIGNAIAVTGFTQATDISNYSFNALVTSVPLGPHTLYVRTMDETGKWSITNNHSFNGGVAVPIILTLFDAILQADNTVLLNWETAQEINLAAYQLERSADGFSWEKIGEVMPESPNTSEKRWYNFTDKKPGIGLLYYRLRNNDLDGQHNYSVVRTVYISTSGNYEATVFPNPSKGSELSFKLSQNVNKKIIARIINASGIAFLQQTVSLSGAGGYTFDGLNLAAGNYFLQLQIGEDMVVSKFTVQ